MTPDWEINTSSVHQKPTSVGEAPTAEPPRPEGSRITKTALRSGCNNALSACLYFLFLFLSFILPSSSQQAQSLQRPTSASGSLGLFTDVSAGNKDFKVGR